jgi:CRP-like cAMP-binding protein
MLPRNLQTELFDLGKAVDLKHNECLLDDSGQSEFIYFPFCGFISLVTSVDKHPAMEIALIGREGMLGMALLAGNSVPPLQAVVQGAGRALRIETTTLQKELLASSTLRLIVGHHSHLLLTELANTITCSNFHAVKPRLAKRLLSIQDRAEADHFHYTHQALADMLGVRRSAISIAAGELQQEKCISYSRGNITIADRRALEAVSCSCYKQVKHSLRIVKNSLAIVCMNRNRYVANS